jgi:hypothetical protein
VFARQASDTGLRGKRILRARIGRSPLLLALQAALWWDTAPHLLTTSKHVGDPDHLKVFANVDAAETWFEENDPEGVAFEYEVLEWMRAGDPDSVSRSTLSDRDWLALWGPWARVENSPEWFATDDGLVALMNSAWLTADDHST